MPVVQLDERPPSEPGAGSIGRALSGRISQELNLDRTGRNAQIPHSDRSLTFHQKYFAQDGWRNASLPALGMAWWPKAMNPWNTGGVLKKTAFQRPRDGCAVA
jgi:hypothetical protein